MKRKKIIRKIEVCAPAGSWESLAAAIKAGADSIYFGAGKLNMRSHSSANFAKDDIFRISEKCHRAGVYSYLALNSIIYDEDIENAVAFCDCAKNAGISAVIVSDFSMLEYAKSISIPAHVSVQMNVSNFKSLKSLAKFADVFVLARELNLNQITKIAKLIHEEKIISPSGLPPRIELFVHGALCMAVSGTCGMSLASYGKSAFRGECYQNCRRRYRVFDDETGQEYVLDNGYVMSPKDLCCIRILDRIIESGVSILKIEGRGRSPDYVYETAKTYCEARDMVLEGRFKDDLAKELEKRLESVFNRGFWKGGYYLGDRSGEWSGISGGRNEKKKIFAGRVTNYFQKAKCAELSLEAEGINLEDELLATGATTGVLKFKVSSLKSNRLSVKSAKKGTVVTLTIPEKVRRGDKVYVLRG
ncbi:MAG TPA: peptidase U32 family protein [Victivallales bacterium]|nr:peptidase U32 family protein [Victivallales bacterium]